jgi:RecJ-like exonuclease
MTTIMNQGIGDRVADDSPAMTAAELKTRREYLGLSTAWIAEQLVIGIRRLERMESGQEAHIPPVVTALLDDIDDETQDTVERMIATYRRKMKAAGTDPVPLYTYRTDKEYQLAGGKSPARWHRHVCARVADSARGVMLIYTTPADTTGVNIGERLSGVVTTTTDFGAFVSLRPDLEGLIHVSQIAAGKRIDNVEDYLKKGDEVAVEVVDVNCEGKVALKLLG